MQLASLCELGKLRIRALAPQEERQACRELAVVERVNRARRRIGRRSKCSVQKLRAAQDRRDPRLDAAFEAGFGRSCFVEAEQRLDLRLGDRASKSLGRE